MTENKNAKTPTDGGAAFPVAHSYLIQSGMSLRDYLAAKAMNQLFEVWEEFEGWGFEDIAERSYAMADAMLKAREL